MPMDICAKVGAAVNARATRTVEIQRLFIEILTCSGLDVAASVSRFPFNMTGYSSMTGFRASPVR